MKIQYKSCLKDCAKELRNNSTLSEVLLWNALKGQQIDRYKFMRQKPIDMYIVDSNCISVKHIFLT